MDTGRGTDPYTNISCEQRERVPGTEHTSWISVRRPLVAVVGEGWLPAVVTRRIVDSADKNAENSLWTRFGGLPPAPFLRTPSEVSIEAGVSHPASPLELEQLLGRLTRMVGGCRNVG